MSNKMVHEKYEEEKNFKYQMIFANLTFWYEKNVSRYVLIIILDHCELKLNSFLLYISTDQGIVNTLEEPLWMVQAKIQN